MSNNNTNNHLNEMIDEFLHEGNVNIVTNPSPNLIQEQIDLYNQVQSDYKKKSKSKDQEPFEEKKIVEYYVEGTTKIIPASEYMDLREKALENAALKRTIQNLQQNRKAEYESLQDEIKRLQKKLQIAKQYRDVALRYKEEINALKLTSLLLANKKIESAHVGIEPTSLA